MPSDKFDVLVIGAGLAGLRCARVLAAAGRDVQVWEAADEVGGRIRTRAIDGFLCDRGFQVLNPAYPELKRAIDISDLRLQPFGAGVAVRRQSGSAVWVHPLREPARVPSMLAHGGVRPAGVLALLRWSLPALRPRALKSSQRQDRSLREGLDRQGVRGELRRVIDQFLAGVVLDDTGATSNAFALLLARVFLLGVPALPSDGMRSLPRQLAAPLGDRIVLQRSALHVESDADGWQVHSPDGVVHATHVVVATDPAAAAALTDVATPPAHGVVTDWWATDQMPPGPAMLWIDSRTDKPGPVINTAVISAAAPTYAPRGHHLIAATALLAPTATPPPEDATRQHAADILGADGRSWTLLTRDVIPEALPAQLPPLRVRQSVRLAAGLWCCGDHRDTASIQGALVSGRRTGEAILRSPARI
ncbi:FAD-dependent oxidoreductase [Mycobacterium spongiae]|uniref:FAD-dependent oxidoreductase n=1 Tax=Mycobacterium spongiae TaxID=886343 RepID=A0A975PX63_9MYCO|nr:FAD-dependent oxidoreductase [Mycobacterium spongiae]QUR67484.1 FAD-dependent oxidoreductase [Mycobacterium spongiae]